MARERATPLTPRKREGYKDRFARRLPCARRQFKTPKSPASAPHSILKGRSVNKSEMIDAIARHADISKAAAGRALDATVGAIKTSLRKGDIVTLVGFGSFYVGKRSPRAGRNPRTGDTIKIKGGKVPKFRAGKALKDALN
jgi:DNA-binding protein HU-beta